MIGRALQLYRTTGAVLKICFRKHKQHTRRAMLPRHDNKLPRVERRTAPATKQRRHLNSWNAAHSGIWFAELLPSLCHAITPTTVGHTSLVLLLTTVHRDSRASYGASLFIIKGELVSLGESLVKHRTFPAPSDIVVAVCVHRCCNVTGMPPLPLHQRCQRCATSPTLSNQTLQHRHWRTSK